MNLHLHIPSQSCYAKWVVLAAGSGDERKAAGRAGNLWAEVLAVSDVLLTGMCSGIAGMWIKALQKRWKGGGERRRLKKDEKDKAVKEKESRADAFADIWYCWYVKDMEGMWWAEGDEAQGL